MDSELIPVYVGIRGAYGPCPGWVKPEWEVDENEPPYLETAGVDLLIDQSFGWLLESLDAGCQRGEVIKWAEGKRYVIAVHDFGHVTEHTTTFATKCPETGLWKIIDKTLSWTVTGLR